MNLSAWTSRTETPGILAVFVGIEVVGWEGCAGGEVEVADSRA